MDNSGKALCTIIIAGLLVWLLLWVQSTPTGMSINTYLEQFY